MKVLLFGDVFLYKGIEHVFLVDAGEVWYAAKIISKIHTKILSREYERAVARSKARTERMPLYCFVELQTREFKDRAAHLHHSQKNSYSEIPKPLAIKLTDEDKKAIRDIIITKKSPVPGQLKKLVKKLELNY